MYQHYLLSLIVVLSLVCRYDAFFLSLRDYRQLFRLLPRFPDQNYRTAIRITDRSRQDINDNRDRGERGNNQNRNRVENDHHHHHFHHHHDPDINEELHHNYHKIVKHDDHSYRPKNHQKATYNKGNRAKCSYGSHEDLDAYYDHDYDYNRRHYQTKSHKSHEYSSSEYPRNSKQSLNHRVEDNKSDEVIDNDSHFKKDNIKRKDHYHSNRHSFHLPEAIKDLADIDSKIVKDYVSGILIVVPRSVKDSNNREFDGIGTISNLNSRKSISNSEGTLYNPNVFREYFLRGYPQGSVI